MADSKFVITGEAPESDEESIDNDKANSTSGYGTAVNGEALESDDEVVSYAAKSRRKPEQSAPELKRSPQRNHLNNSILQKKLCDSNAKLWKDLNDCLYSTIFAASKELLNADQQLLKSQVTLQSISYNFKIAEASTKQILTKTKDIISGNFIPPINI
ncbi:unnamed protein product [Hermetia illucens]|uniref:Biogenesis of lysosome-related organelles complex 1 subunit 3 n=1 Tax=Hermetia illucens TaxID=343691 RepID=A0A7R8YRI0_HERIL|nr:biogenesis of lysosome-related organelles complex 1 subunit 3 [Hermetia illucens]CAD7081525.1 unnamed protein product [Hermetia illucens]